MNNVNVILKYNENNFYKIKFKIFVRIWRKIKDIKKQNKS